LDDAQIDRELFARSVATLVQSWALLAGGSPGARLIDADGAAIAVFVRAPERESHNNAVLARGLEDPEPALAQIAAAYAEVGVGSYAVWVTESDTAVAEHVRAHGYVWSESTRTMAVRLDTLPSFDTSGLELGTPPFDDFMAMNGLPLHLFSTWSDDGHIYVARADGQNAAALMTLDHDRDCGIYNVFTLPFARRRGIGTALTALALQEARARGCTTASLQSTPMAERVYAAAGFRDLGRYDEYVPQS
jgi:GNAT superfamily N-acetyltransferase